MFIGHHASAFPFFIAFALWALVLFLAVVYIGNFTSPPPPDVKAIGWGGLAQWLFVPWGWWIDRHREAAR